MNVTFDTEKILAALQDFYNATGIDMELLKADFTPAVHHRQHNNCYCGTIQSTPKGCYACRRSDMELLSQCAATGQVQMHVCHAGLVDVAIPILYDDQIIGYIIFGRMKPNRDFSTLERYIAGLGADTARAEAAYRQIPFFDADRIKSISRIATLLLKYILLENMLLPSVSSSLAKATAFIRNNLDKELSIQTISRGASVSKSVLYKDFHEQLHCTVGSYIKEKRVEKSLEFLVGTELSIEEVSQRVGFSSASYYSKIFKQQMGLSPLQYRKQSNI